MNSVRSLTVFVVAVLSLAVGCGEQDAASGPSGALIAPASAAVFVSIRTDSGSDQWQQAEDLIAKFPDGRRAIDSILSELSGKGLDFRQDVEPALGPETDIVGLDLSGDGEFVGLTQPEDTQKLKDVLAQVDTKMVTGRSTAGRPSPTARARSTTSNPLEKAARSRARATTRTRWAR